MESQVLQVMSSNKCRGQKTGIQDPLGVSNLIVKSIRLDCSLFSQLSGIVMKGKLYLLLLKSDPHLDPCSAGIFFYSVYLSSVIIVIKQVIFQKISQKRR